MGTSSKSLALKLRKLADRQHGCFTAAQAVETGYADSVHLYHVHNGEWNRISRGIYRFSDAPETAASRCMAALLWTRDKRGIVQGFLRTPTVLALRGGILDSSSPIFIGVPKGFRRSSRIPESIRLETVDPQCCITSKINGLRMEMAIEAPPPGMDLPDYYDWLDYQAARCAPSSS